MRSLQPNQRLLKVNGVGAKVALGAMSTFPAARLARAIVEIVNETFER